jgi:hypothetical protein
MILQSNVGKRLFHSSYERKQSINVTASF